jgi:thioredoxin-related protein
VKYKRRKWISRAVAMVAALTAHTSSAAGVPLAENLHEEGLQAESGCKPLLLEFSASSCSYCQVLEEEVLNPTVLDRDYDRRVLMRKVLIDGSERLTDFDGSKSINTGQLARRYKVHVTPTLVFVDSQGQELAKQMVGVTTLEFYGGYLDAALDISREKLRALNKCDVENSLRP